MALYVSDKLNHSACPLFDAVSFNCLSWCTILLSDSKRLLVGVVYRSPNSPDENNERMLEILRITSTAKFDYLLVCRDLNLPRIDWTAKQCLDTENSFSADFMETVEQLEWFQHSKDDTRFRGTQSLCLDLIFTSERDVINEVNELPPLGKSDHVCQQWEVTVKEAIFKNTTRLRPNYKRAEWAKISSDIRGFTFQPDDQVGVMTDRLVDMIDASRKRNVP